MIAPSILNANNLELESDIDQAISAGISRFHIDIMDGHFVPNLSFGPELVKDFKHKYPNIEAEVHLMSDNPKVFVPAFVKSGADLIILHYEAMSEIELSKWIGYLFEHNVKVGLAVNPDTSVSVLNKFLTKIDQILIMSVFPGFGGQKFISKTSEKIETLKVTLKESNLDVAIEVDGGINKDTAGIAHKAGADILVAGSYIFSAKNIQNQIKELKKTLL